MFVGWLAVGSWLKFIDRDFLWDLIGKSICVRSSTDLGSSQRHDAADQHDCDKPDNRC